MQKTSQTGSSGEYLAQEYLKNKNYTILFINWRHKRSEIDIIAQDGKGNRICRSKNENKSYLSDILKTLWMQTKLKKCRKRQHAYIEQFDWQGELRYDIIAVEKNNKITHFEDAFY
jgi:putative endonuclease